VAKALLRSAAAEREAWLEAVTNDPLLPGRILPSDYLGQQARWPPAKAGGGWKCSGTPADNCEHSNPNSPVQNLVADATKVRHANHARSTRRDLNQALYFALPLQPVTRNCVQPQNGFQLSPRFGSIKRIGEPHFGQTGLEVSASFFR